MINISHGESAFVEPSIAVIAAAAAALSSLPILGADLDAPPPVCDLEEIFGAANLADVKSRYRHGAYAGAVPHEVDDLFAEDGRFNLSHAARFALAQILYDGKEVIFLSPTHSHRREQFVLHLFRSYGVPYFSRCGIPHVEGFGTTADEERHRIIGGLYGRLTVPPFENAILLTQETHCFGVRVNPKGIPLFERCIVI